MMNCVLKMIDFAAGAAAEATLKDVKVIRWIQNHAGFSIGFLLNNEECLLKNDGVMDVKAALGMLPPVV